MKLAKRNGGASRVGIASMIAFFMFVVLGWPQTNVCDQEGVVFCNGFEEQGTALSQVWGDPYASQNATTDVGPFNIAGNRILRLSIPSGGTSRVSKVFTNYGYDSLYARWYLKWEPVAANRPPHHHGSGFLASIRSNTANIGRAGYSPDGSWYRFWFENFIHAARPYLYTYYANQHMDCPSQGNCWGDHYPCIDDEMGASYCAKTLPIYRQKTPPEMVSGQWYCVEIFAQGGTPTSSKTGASGVLNFWLDGVEYGPWPNMWLRTSPDVKLAVFSFMVYNAEAITQGALYDDLVISTKRVGVGGRATTSKDITNVPPMIQKGAQGPSLDQISPSLSLYRNGAEGNAVLAIAYSLPLQSRVALGIYGHRGELVKRILAGNRPAGVHRVSWGGKDQHGFKVMGGLYLCKLEVDGKRCVEKVILLR